VQAILKHLLDLQALDIRLFDVRTRLAAFPKRLAEVEARVAAAKSDLEKSKAAQLSTLKERKKYELDVDQWKEKVRKYKDQLYEVKTNEAYKTLQHEIQTVEREIAKSEDRLLEQMVASEEYDRRVKAAEKALAEIEAAARADRAKIQAEQTAADEERAKLEAERQQVITEVPEDLLDHYTRIAKKHGGVALAEIREETCTQCGVRVRPHVFQELRREDNKELYHCETCTRILYFVEPPPAASQTSAGSEQAPLAHSNNG
jgi:uncharacterized protein